MTETTDSGISETEENVTSKSSSTQSLIQYVEVRPLVQENSTVIHINEDTPLLSCPRRRRYSFDVHIPEYTSETALSQLTDNSVKRKKEAALNYYQHNVKSPSFVINIPVETTSSPQTFMGFDYGASYPDIVKTMSITAFGAVEV